MFVTKGVVYSIKKLFRVIVVWNISLIANSRVVETLSYIYDHKLNDWFNSSDMLHKTVIKVKWKTDRGV